MSSNYFKVSSSIQQVIYEIFQEIIDKGMKNKVLLQTSLKRGMPEKDIHKIAGPITDEWVYETLDDYSKKTCKRYQIENVQSMGSSSLEDVYFEIRDSKNNLVPVLIDVKSASLEKGASAGKGSNITSFRKIRPHYVNNPNSIFLCLSVKNLPYKENGKRKGFDFVGIHLFDIKLVSQNELKLNKRMGDQFQISNSTNVTQVDRSTEDFINMIDSKYINAYSIEQLNELIKNNYKTKKKSSAIIEDEEDNE